MPLKNVTIMTQITKNKRAYNVSSIVSKKHKEIPLSNKWAKHIGIPEASGVWFVYGHSGNGKSSYIMQLVKELCLHGKVLYNDLEEGVRLSLKKNIVRAGLEDDPKVKRNFLVLDKEPMDDLIIRLKKHKSAKYIFINSWQYTGFNLSQFHKLINAFPDKLFIIISHADGKNPDGSVAKKILYHADVKIWVEGFKAIPTSRYEANEEYIIWDEGAAKYWLDIKSE